MESVEAVDIQEFVKSRGIESLLHFTKVDNVPGILRHGLIGRKSLTRLGLHAEINDQYRYDHAPDAVCASISFPNYKMFYRLQQNNPQADWVILRIKPSVLWEIPCAYCASNAASSDVTSIPIKDRMTLFALKAMFGESSSDIDRASLKIPDRYTTNPQAEVLILGAVDSSYIMSVNINQRHRINDMNSVVNLFAPYRGKFEFFHDPGLFTYRKDYERWQRPQESHDVSDIDFAKPIEF